VRHGNLLDTRMHQPAPTCRRAPSNETWVTSPDPATWVYLAGDLALLRRALLISHVNHAPSAPFGRCNRRAGVATRQQNLAGRPRVLTLAEN